MTDESKASKAHSKVEMVQPTPIAEVDMITLTALCSELKLDPREARMTLRLAAKDVKTYPALAETHQPRQAWVWKKASPGEQQARKALSVRPAA